MIADTLAHWSRYQYGEHLERAFRFLHRLKGDCAPGEYPIVGQSLFSRVLEYETSTTPKWEAHRTFADLQIVLSGEEWIDVTSRPLEQSIPYDAAKDVEFFHPPAFTPVRIHLVPGDFAIFFPGEAHAPALSVGPSPVAVKKVVIKIDHDLLFGRHADFS